MIIYMKQLKTALFDFDGVVVDTEPIYDLFWNDAAKRYGLGIDNFADIIEGYDPTVYSGEVFFPDIRRSSAKW